MKKVLLVLTLALGTLIINAQTRVSAKLEDGKGNPITISFVVVEKGVNEFLTKKEVVDSYKNKKPSLSYYLEVANIECMYKMKYSTSYIPIQSKSNSVTYNKEENSLVVRITASGKNSYGGVIEDVHMITFKGDETNSLPIFIY